MNHETRAKSRVTPQRLRRKGLLAPLLAALAMCAAACTSETPGQPTGSNTPTLSNRPTIPGGGTSTASPTGPKKPDPNASPVRSMDPCTLLTAAQASELGVAQGKRDDSGTGTSRTCEFVASGRFNLGVTIFDVVGTKDVQATGEIKSVPSVGKHQAVQYGYGTGCAVSIAITETSRVDAIVSAGSDTAKACQIALQAAQMIEPKLPGGS